MKSQKAKKIIQKILDIIQIDAQIDVLEKEDLLRVQINTQEANHLIGQQGKNLFALESLLRQIFFKQLGSGIKFVLDINNYRKNKEEMVKDQALDFAQRAKNEKRVVALPPMNSYERRLVHTILASDSEVQTNSEGEGLQRKVLIKPKSDFLV